VKAAASKNSHLNAHADYLNAYWAADYSGITNPLFNVQCTYPANKIIGNESVFYGGKWSGGKWNLAGAVDTAQNRITISNISDLGEITAAGSDYIGGAAIVDVKAMPEGFYNESTDKLNMRDTLKAFAAGITTPYGLVDSSLAVFDSVTFTSRHFFRNLTDGNYYLVLRHRNSIETWSRQGG
jgi:hypothetical protein